MLDLVSYITPIGTLVFFTFIIGVLFLKKNNTIHLLVQSILLVNFLTELLAIILLGNSIKLFSLYSISFLFHNFLWILLLSKLNNSRYYLIVPILFFCFGLFNLFFWECNNINQKTFVFGALIYILLFIYTSFKNLRRENLDFFSSNNYIVLFAPILSFFGMSLLFGFGDFNIFNFMLFKNVNLYSLINYFIYLIYYGFIIIYIYKERKREND